MPGPPPHLTERRAARRRQLRRRQLMLGVLLLAVVAVSAALLAGRGGSGEPASATDPATGSGAAPLPPRQLRRARTQAQAGATEVRHLARLGLPVYCGGRHGNEVAFTFDDGPGPYTHYAIKKLTEAHERATFFTVGRSIDNFPGWLPRELRVGVIGDHTMTHPVLTELSSSEIKDQITGTAEKIRHETGEHVQLFRPPYGARNTVVDGIARRLGVLEILWNVDSADSLGADWAGIIHNVEAGLHPGSIILMHENRGQTIRALTTLLPELHRRHLRSVTVPELLASDPPSLAQLRAGESACPGNVLHGNGS